MLYVMLFIAIFCVKTPRIWNKNFEICGNFLPKSLIPVSPSQKFLFSWAAYRRAVLDSGRHIYGWFYTEIKQILRHSIVAEFTQNPGVLAIGHRIRFYSKKYNRKESQVIIIIILVFWHRLKNAVWNQIRPNVLNRCL